MSINGAEANRVGLTPEQVAGAVSGALLGVPAGEVRLQDRSIGVRVRAPDAVRSDALRLGALPVVDPGEPHDRAALGAGDASSRRRRARTYTRENQQQMITMTSDVSGRSLGAVMKDVKAILAQNPPPRGIRVEIGGQYAGQQSAFRSMLAVLALAAAAVIAVMVLQFRSFVEPLVVLARRADLVRRRDRAAARHRHAAERVVVHGADPARRADREERDHPARLHASPHARRRARRSSRRCSRRGACVCVRS